MKRPSLDLAVAFNHSIRESDEWFDERDAWIGLVLPFRLQAVSRTPSEPGA